MLQATIYRVFLSSLATIVDHATIVPIPMTVPLLLPIHDVNTSAGLNKPVDLTESW